MYRIKDGRISKPGPGRNPRRRGRPSVDWNRSRQRRLLRLYLCTPESELPLKEILKIMTSGSFSPKLRLAQVILKGLLPQSYRQKRPRNRSCMRRRLAVLRSIRDRPDASLISDDALAACSILLVRDPSESTSVQSSPTTSSTVDRTLESYRKSASPSSCFVDPSPMQGCANSSTALSSSRAVFKRSGSDSIARRLSRIQYLRQALPGRTSSFLADCASLLSGLSIRSSMISMGSSTASLVSDTAKTSAGMEEMSASPQDNSKSETKGTRSPGSDSAFSTASFLSRFPMPWSSGSVAHRENEAVIALCCSTTTNCIHRRIRDEISRAESPTDFAVTLEELGGVDSLGNTVLHVAARWGAPQSVLMSLISAMGYISGMDRNHQRETFLHVMNPPSDRPYTPDFFLHLSKLLRDRSFNVCQVDAEGRTYVERLLSRPAFSIQCLEALLAGQPESERLHLLHPKSGNSERIMKLIGQKFDSCISDAPARERYCKYIQKRYGTRHCQTKVQAPGGQTILLNLAENTEGENMLHRVVSALNVGKNMWPSASHDLGEKLDGSPVDILTVIDAAIATVEDVNAVEPLKRQTPLMALLEALSWGQHSEAVMFALVTKLLDAGAQLDCQDIYRNTAIHYAAGLGLFVPLAIFVERVQPSPWIRQPYIQSPLVLAAEGLQFQDRLQSYMIDSMCVVARYKDCVDILSQCPTYYVWQSLEPISGSQCSFRVRNEDFKALSQWQSSCKDPDNWMLFSNFSHQAAVFSTPFELSQSLASISSEPTASSTIRFEIPKNQLFNTNPHMN